jgi:hypothetical protein
MDARRIAEPALVERAHHRPACLGTQGRGRVAIEVDHRPFITPFITPLIAPFIAGSRA